MKRIIIHQWRDWLLEYIGEGKYELVRKDDQSVHEVEAKSHMEAEKKCQVLIKKLTEEARESKQLS